MTPARTPSDPVAATRRAIATLDNPWTPEERTLAVQVLIEITTSTHPIPNQDHLPRTCLETARRLLRTRSHR